MSLDALRLLRGASRNTNSHTADRTTAEQKASEQTGLKQQGFEDKNSKRKDPEQQDPEQRDAEHKDNEPRASAEKRERNKVEDAEVLKWFGANAIKLRTIDADQNFDDLEPMVQPLRKARIVGIGEATHGTSDFFRLKHRLFRFLVTRMGFRALALEADNSECAAINDYVRTGRGSAQAALCGLTRVHWKCEEILALIEWMREYNQSLSAEQFKTQSLFFIGMERDQPSLPASAVLQYLETIDSPALPEMRETAKVILDIVTDWDNKTDDDLVRAHELVFQSTSKVRRAIRDDHSSRTGKAERVAALKQLELFKDCALEQTGGPNEGSNIRDRFYGQNRKPDSKGLRLEHQDSDMGS